MEEKNESKQLVICKKCGRHIDYSEEDAYWDESGYGYSTKLVDCDGCGCPNVLKYKEDRWLNEI